MGEPGQRKHCGSAWNRGCCVEPWWFSDASDDSHVARLIHHKLPDTVRICCLCQLARKRALLDATAPSADTLDRGSPASESSHQWLSPSEIELVPLEDVVELLASSMNDASVVMRDLAFRRRLSKHCANSAPRACPLAGGRVLTVRA